MPVTGYAINIYTHIREMYDVEVSAMTLSEITDRIIPLVKEWQNLPLDEVYPSGSLAANAFTIVIIFVF